MRIPTASAAMLLVFVIMSAGSALGETCIPPDQAISVERIDAFRDNPKAILDARDLTDSVRDLVASDTTLAPLVVALLPGLNPERSTFIGAALGQAALSCLRNFPGDAVKAEAAGAIQQAIAATDDVSALLAYNNAAENVQTSSTGGADGASAGSAALEGISIGGAYRPYDELDSEAPTVVPKLLDFGVTGSSALPVSIH